MIIGENNQPPREVSGLTDKQRGDIAIYLQGMVYGWCESKRTESFAAHNLVGGVNKDWNGTPLQCVYDKQQTDEETAHYVAAQEVGRLLKLVIIDDQRKFTCAKKGRETNYYTWDGKCPKA